LAAGEIALVLGGDCTVGLGTVAGLKGAFIEIRPLTWCLSRRGQLLGWGESPCGGDEWPNSAGSD